MGTERSNSVQARAAEQFRDIGFNVIFDDDAPDETANLVCFRMNEEVIILL